MFLRLGAIALAFGIGTAAHSASITFEQFSVGGWNGATAGAITEDFETSNNTNRTFEGAPRNSGGNLYGELDAFGYTSQAVGQFRSLGGSGSGSTCNANDLVGNGCSQIALQYDPGINGQGNLLPEDGFWSLNSNDTHGISWKAMLADGQMFTRVVFALTDPADTGARSLMISVGDMLLGTWNSLPDAGRWLAVIDFDTAVNSAIINIRTSSNDGFTFDGGAIAPVPLPAAAFLLIGGLGALVVVRRRQKTA